MKFLGWDLDVINQVSRLGGKWIWKGKHCWNYFFLGLSIHQNSDTRYKLTPSRSWKPVQVTKSDFQNFNSPPQVKFLDWDLDGKNQVSRLGGNWVWKKKHCWNYFFLGLSIHQNSDTRYKLTPSRSWKPVQVTKSDFQNFNSPPQVKFLGWDLDVRNQANRLGGKWVWKRKHCWNYFFEFIDPSNLRHQV